MKGMIKQYAVVMATAMMVVMNVGSAHAAADKIGTVDLRRVWREYKGMQDVMQKLKDAAAQKQVEVDAKKEEIAKLREEYEKKSVILSEAEKEKKSKEIDEKAKVFREHLIEINKELQEMEAELRGKVIDHVRSVVTEIGKKKGYKIIFNNTEALLLYADGSMDITEEVLKAL